MRHLRPYLALLAIAAITSACSGAPGSSSGGESSQAAGESQPAASSGGGGGGGGGGANGSITYDFGGDYDASGELPFLAAGAQQWIEAENGWVANFAEESGEGAYILLNTGVGTDFTLLTFGDGTIVVTASNDPSAGTDCTLHEEKNDSGGLKGSLDCTSTVAANATSGVLMNVSLHAEWDAHT